MSATVDTAFIPLKTSHTIQLTSNPTVPQGTTEALYNDETV